MNSGSIHVDETLARYSDLLFGTAITIYVLAMILFLAALAGARSRRLAATELVAAGAGSGSTPRSADARVPGRVDGPPQRSLGEKLGNMAYPVVFVGLIAQIASIVLRGVATDRGFTCSWISCCRLRQSISRGGRLFALD